MEETQTGFAKPFARHGLPRIRLHRPRKVRPVVSCLVPLRTAPTGNQTQSGTSMSKNRVRGSDPPMAGQCQIKSATHAVS